MSEQTKTFQLGDLVTWTSQAGGKSKTKTGKVLFVIPPGKILREIFTGSPELEISHLGIYGTRDHESYLIQVGKSKRLYWPLVKYLNAATFGPEPIQTEEPNNA